MERAGLGKTIGIGVGVVLAAALTRLAAMAAAARVSGADVESTDPVVRHDGLLVGCGILGGALAGMLVLLVLAPRSSLALVRPRMRAVALWLGAAVLLVAGFDVVGHALGRPLVEAAWRDVFRTGPVWLLALALVATSVFEELFVRGFLQTRLAATRVGGGGAIAITALLFALSHAPRDVFRFADVLAAGVLLALARQRSGSTITSMIPHVLGNLKVLVVIALT